MFNKQTNKTKPKHITDMYWKSSEPLAVKIIHTCKWEISFLGGGVVVVFLSYR